MSDFSHQIHINIERLYMLLLVLVFITFNKFPLLLGQCLSGYIWASDSNNGYDINAEIEDKSDDENDGFYYYYSGIFHFLAMKIPFYFWLILIVAIIWYLIVLRVFCWSRQSTSPKPSQDQLTTTFDWSTPTTSTIYYVWLLFIIS